MHAPLGTPRSFFRHAVLQEGEYPEIVISEQNRYGPADGIAYRIREEYSNRRGHNDCGTKPTVDISADRSTLVQGEDDHLTTVDKEAPFVERTSSDYEYIDDFMIESSAFES